MPATRHSVNSDNNKPGTFPIRDTNLTLSNVTAYEGRGFGKWDDRAQFSMHLDHSLRFANVLKEKCFNFAQARTFNVCDVFPRHRRAVERWKVLAHKKMDAAGVHAR
jgi:hypothetical protein